jgi:hypothetical protein
MSNGSPFVDGECSVDLTVAVLEAIRLKFGYLRSRPLSRTEVVDLNSAACGRRSRNDRMCVTEILAWILKDWRALTRGETARQPIQIAFIVAE